MKVSCIFFIVAAAFFKAVIAAEGDEVLAGYLVLSDDSKCLGTNGISAGTPSSTSQTDLDAACIKLSLLEGSAANKYKVVKKETTTEKLKLVDTQAPAFVTDGSETEIQFSDEAAVIDATTTTSVTTKAQSFLIQLDGATVTDTDICLTATPDYQATSCGNIKWYFIVICEVANCETCQSASTCDSCTDGTHVVNAGKTACQDCNTAFPGCSTCSDTSGTAQCTDTTTIDGADDSTDDSTDGDTDADDSDTTTTTADGSTLTHAPLLSVVMFVLGMKFLACL